MIEGYQDKGINEKMERIRSASASDGCDCVDCPERDCWKDERARGLGVGDFLGAVYGIFWGSNAASERVSCCWTPVLR